MKVVNVKVGGYDAIIKEGKVIITIDDGKTIVIHKDQIFMLGKIMEKM
jgi:hypothetical protein